MNLHSENQLRASCFSPVENSPVMLANERDERRAGAEITRDIATAVRLIYYLQSPRFSARPEAVGVVVINFSFGLICSRVVAELFPSSSARVSPLRSDGETRVTARFWSRVFIIRIGNFENFGNFGEFRVRAFIAAAGPLLAAN